MRKYFSLILLFIFSNNLYSRLRYALFSRPIVVRRRISHSSSVVIQSETVKREMELSSSRGENGEKLCRRWLGFESKGNKKNFFFRTVLSDTSYQGPYIVFVLEAIYLHTHSTMIAYSLL